MCDQDGNYYLFDLDYSWPQKIDGKDIEEVFEEGDIVFAG